MNTQTQTRDKDPEHKGCKNKTVKTFRVMIKKVFEHRNRHRTDRREKLNKSKKNCFKKCHRS